MNNQERYYQGVRMAPYDLVKEVAVALLGVAVVVLILAAVFSSPDVRPVTIQDWAQQDPVNFVSTASSELAGQSASAQYGPPYTGGSGSVQTLGPVAPQAWAGVHLPLDPQQDFVLGPLELASVGNPQLSAALKAYQAAMPKQRQAWLTSYTKALDNAKVQNGLVVTAAGDFGAVPTLMDGLLGVARSGGLDGLLVDTRRFYSTDFSRPLLFLGDGTYLSGLAKRQNLLGNQWGVMNETGSYPGQAWLWLYTMWYQVPPYNTAANADLLVVLTMGFLTLVLALVPFTPVLRDIPRWIPIHRLIWRRDYRDASSAHVE
ncbi:MAG TPA: hypothetical protein VMW62_05995 [Chloroflexota bacterium]|nr:hypothetical protein [Chloroflexota bacterium]